MGVTLTSRVAVAAAGAVSLILSSTAQCSTAFVLQSPSLRPTQQQERSRAVVGAASSALPARAPRRRLASPAALPIAKTGARWGGFARLAAEPEGATAEKDSDGEQQSIPGEGEVVGDVEGALEEEGEEGGEEVAVDEQEGVAAETSEGETELVEEEEEEEVDPMAEVKQQIKDLEKELQQAENKLADATDAISEKGQMGFLRMAAMVDNFRKKSGSGSGEYESDAKAAVLKAMLPAFAPFEAAEAELKLETENEIKFNGNYQALYRQLKDAYTKIGASDFFGVVGEKFDSRRHIKMSDEHHPVMAAGNVLQCLSPGLELKKNVIQKASCVVSLGPEKVAEEEVEEVEEEVEEAVGGEGEGEGEEDAAPTGTLRDAGAAEGEVEAEVEGEGGEEPAAA